MRSRDSTASRLEPPIKSDIAATDLARVLLMKPGLKISPPGDLLCCCKNLMCDEVFPPSVRSATKSSRLRYGLSRAILCFLNRY